MGALNTKQWAEVLTTGSPDANEDKTGKTTSSATSSTENSPIPENATESKNNDEDRPRPRHRNLKSLDPRSVSDDVTRTPIQVEKSPESRRSVKNESDEEETDTSGQELLSTPMAIDKHLNKFKVPEKSFLSNRVTQFS